MRDDVTLGEARAWLRPRAAKGAPCPCCRQKVQVYRRKLNGSMARVLIAFYRKDVAQPGGWHKALEVVDESVGYHGSDYGKLAYWGLLESLEKGVGLWRISDDGREFVRNRHRVPSHAVVYDAKVLRVDGGLVGILDVMPKAFNLPELLGERPPSGEPR